MIIYIILLYNTVNCDQTVLVKEIIYVSQFSGYNYTSISEWPLSTAELMELSNKNVVTTTLSPSQYSYSVLRFISKLSEFCRINYKYYKNVYPIADIQAFLDLQIQNVSLEESQQNQKCVKFIFFITETYKLYKKQIQINRVIRQYSLYCNGIMERDVVVFNRTTLLNKKSNKECNDNSFCNIDDICINNKCKKCTENFMKCVSESCCTGSKCLFGCCVPLQPSYLIYLGYFCKSDKECGSVENACYINEQDSDSIGICLPIGLELKKTENILI